MLSLDTQVYSPVLRLKLGECDALAQLASDVRSRLLPLFVVPPPSDSDPEFGGFLETTELFAVSARRLGRAWPLRPCLLDPKFLFEKLDLDSAPDALANFFKLARSYSAAPWLVADLSDLEQFLGRGAIAVLNASEGPLALRLRPEDIEDPAISTRVQKVLLSLVRKPSETILVLDFGNTDFSDTTIVAEVMVATLQRVLAIGMWAHVIWQATSYPEENPAQAGSMNVLNRGEWTAYLKASDLDPIIKSLMIFGDFAADSAKFSFASSKGVIAIPHFRYSTSDKWLVSRAAKEGKLSVEMPLVAARIVGSGLFAGRDFSRGDRFIHDASRGLLTGTARNWRCANTAHHLTRVSMDVGSMRGYSISALPQQAFAEQESFPF